MARTVSAPSSPLVFRFGTDEYRSIPIPGIKHAKMGTCFIKVTDLPPDLERFMEVNPRVPKRTAKGVLSGPVVAGILRTLRESPEDMAIKNQGIFILAEDVFFEKQSGGRGEMTLHLTDPALHGIVNGGHTFAAICEAVGGTTSTEEELEMVDRAYVRLHIVQGIPRDKVADIAEGLNKNKPVDNPSLLNLQGCFDEIIKVMKGKPGEEQIAYYQGHPGSVDVTEVLTFMEMLNPWRFSRTVHPYTLYRNKSSMLRLFEEDYAAGKADSPMQLIVQRLPEILRLSDDIRALVPENAKSVGFEFGRMKTGKREERAGSQRNKGIKLVFNEKPVDYRVPNGWILPMLAAFRANVDTSKKRMDWILPLDKLLPMVIKDLVQVCVNQHKAGLPPEEVAARESSFTQCYDKVLLRLALMGKVSQVELDAK
jgi:hypothetical protein